MEAKGMKMQSLLGKNDCFMLGECGCGSLDVGVFYPWPWHTVHAILRNEPVVAFEYICDDQKRSLPELPPRVWDTDFN